MKNSVTSTEHWLSCLYILAPPENLPVFWPETVLSERRNTDTTAFPLRHINTVYDIKVCGIPSANKLIKTIRYPHM